MTAGVGLGVVLVNYNARLLTEACVASVNAGRVAPESIIVVDNSTLETEWLVEDVGPNVVVIRTANHGFGAACNVGAAALAAKGASMLMVLNNDTTVAPDALALLVEALQGHEADVLVPTILDGHTQRVWYAGGHWNDVFGTAIHHQWGARLVDVTTDPVVTFVSGGAFLMRLEQFMELGGFDESLFLYCEDVELSHRIAKRGLKAGHVAGAVVSHWPGSGSGGDEEGMSPTALFFATRNRLWMLRRGQVRRWPALLLTPWPVLVETGHVLRRSNGRRSRINALLRGLISGALKRCPPIRYGG